MNEPQETEDGKKLMTQQFLKNLLRSDTRLYYNTPALNDILYLHYKGLHDIENLAPFTGLKCLYLEGNAFSEIKGLNRQTELRALYLHENLITKIEGLEYLENLCSLNLSDNFIERIEGLDSNPLIETLLLKRNKIGKNGLSDVRYLATLKQIRVLDLSYNLLHFETEADVEEFVDILSQMENLGVLYLTDNKVIRHIKNYRKTLIIKIPTLKFLDDRPVFPEDRRYAEAFARGGIEEEREERRLYKEEEEQKRKENHEAFRKMISKARERGLENKEDSESDSKSLDNSVPEESNSRNSSSLDTNNLDTYYSDSSNKKETDSESEHEDTLSHQSIESEGKHSVKSEEIQKESETPYIDDVIENKAREEPIFDTYLGELD